MVNFKKVIVVEDDPAINHLIAYNLKKQGYSVTQEFDGSLAQDKLSNEHFNIVILDIMLPGVDGFDICRKLKGSFGNAKTFVVILSAKCQDHEKLYGYLLGADYYLSKPFSVAKLMEVIAELSQMQDKQITVKNACLNFA